jgi:hypothetical protein
MDSPDTESLLAQAVAAVNGGDLVQGRALLEKILESDPRNDWAWVWLSGCVQDPLQRRICLQQALKVNPQNTAAQDGIKVLDGELTQASSAAPSLLESRLAAIGMGEQEPAATAPAPAAEAAIPQSSGEAMAGDAGQAVEGGSPPRRRKRGLLVLLIVLVLLLGALVCGLVAWQVVLPMVGGGTF